MYGKSSVSQGAIVAMSRKFSESLDRHKQIRGLNKSGFKSLDTIAYATNPIDVFDGVLFFAGTDNGCCDSDGQDGLNRACKCGELIAAQWAYCWTQKEVRFISRAVTLN